MVVSLDFDQPKRGPSVLDKDEIRMGFQVWTIDPTKWDNWETKDTKNGKRHLGF